MATDLIIDEARAVQIARAFLAQRMKREPPPMVMVRHRSERERADAAESIKQVCEECGVFDQALVQGHIAQAGLERDHWIVGFRYPDPPGTASTLRTTMVLVFDDTGEADLNT